MDEQRRGSDLLEGYDQGTGSKRIVHRGFNNLRVDTPFPQTRYVKDIKERFMSQGHPFTSPSPSTSGRAEARALTPDMETDRNNWEQEMIKNINELSITGGLTQLQNESFLIQKQE